jgi:hypothetical protein
MKNVKWHDFASMFLQISVHSSTPAADMIKTWYKVYIVFRVKG